jgi:hypothetical protein
MALTTTVRATALAAVTGMSALTLIALAPTASARGGGGDVRTSGKCSSATVWKLKVKTDNGALESEYEVDSNRNGQHWSYRITDNGVLVKSGYARTVAPSGSFEIRALSRNRAGSDHFAARARNTVTGEVCSGALTF